MGTWLDETERLLGALGYPARIRKVAWYLAKKDRVSTRSASPDRVLSAALSRELRKSDELGDKPRLYRRAGVVGLVSWNPQAVALGVREDFESFRVPGFGAAAHPPVRAARPRRDPVETVQEIVVPVPYATDRDRTGHREANRYYGRERADGLEFGVVRVSIPHTHRVGRLERPRIWQLRERRGAHVVAIDVAPHDREALAAVIAEAFEQPGRTREILVYIHGFNQTFAQAARRAAQIAVDLQFPGLPFLFSWPSDGRISRYLKDETNVTWAEPHLEEALEFLAGLKPADLHVVAHSMGSRAISGVVARASRSATSSFKGLIRELVLAAPDIDAATFAALAAHFPGFVRRTTMYGNSNDRALELSQTVHGYQRAGDTSPEVVVVSGTDTVDATALDTDLLGHSYHARPGVLNDMYALIRHGHPPQHRFGLTPRTLPRGVYWAFAQ